MQYIYPNVDLKMNLFCKLIINTLHIVHNEHTYKHKHKKYII